jgi:phage tail sheath protein FI
MPEYLAPGVYVEETSFRAKSIEGVGTSTTGFVGPTRKGPVGGTPELITSFGDFERIYGGLDNLNLGNAGNIPLNYLAHAVRNYFDNGGARLYVSRAYVAPGGGAGMAASDPVVAGGAADDQARFVARFPGAAGNGRITVRQVRLPATLNSMNGAPEGTLLRSNLPGGADRFHVKRGIAWQDSGGTSLDLTGVVATSPPGESADILTIALVAEDRDGHQLIYDDLGFDRGHPRWIGNVLGTNPGRRRDALENLFAIEIGADVDAFELRSGLFATGDSPPAIELDDGSDGNAPTQAAYEDALAEMEKLDDIAIIAAPGHSAYQDAQGIQGALISHAERRRAYRIAVLDTPPEQSVSDARTARSRIDSKYAALYYPWVVVSNPLARPGVENAPREITLPPSGFVCGIYARNDVERGVAKVPANEVVRGALRFESDVNFAQQEVLNPLGVNCLRYFAGRGYRVWGGRTVSSDPEWKYVNVRRYFNFLENSIDRGTQWAVFENNGERLWANIRDTISGFLYNEWVNGALLGSTAEEAFFVRCDRSTMTQNDLDNGRLVCLIGVAVLKPAEFVIFRIGQKTADSRS